MLFLGSNGFPFGMAAIQRQLQIAKAMKNDHSRVLVVNRKGVHSKSVIQHEKIKTAGTFEGIEYVYSSGTPRYPNNFMVRNVLKIIGNLGELFEVIYHRIFQNLQCLVINSLSLSELKYYYYLSRMINVRLVYDYVEYMSSLEDRSIKTASTKQTFDNLFFKYTDSLIIISHFLERHIKSVALGLPYVVVPPIMDFEKFAALQSKPPENEYFLYCGSTHYFDVIEFVIEAYQKAAGSHHEVALMLVVNGDPEKMAKLQRSIQHNKSIKVVSNLPYETLIGYYKNAKALLIPLQDNLQDKARFPFKISEYTAAARPIVTSNSGAVVDYFTDGIDALLAKTGDADDFASKLALIMANPEQAEVIAKNGYQLGVKHFNYKSYSAPLMELISN